MKQKIKAASLHFCISALIIGLLAGFTILHFYPSVFLDIENTSDALKILVIVDSILGPLLTLIIYKRGKPGLKFDLVFIIICQLMALAYGCWAIYSARPGYLVFYGDTFYIVPPSIDQSPIKDPSLKIGKLDSPKIVSLHLPGDVKTRLALAMESLNSGIPLQWQTRYFEKFDLASSDTLAQASLDIDKYTKNANTKTLALLGKIRQSNTRYAYIPVMGTRTSKIIVLNIATRQPEYVLDIFPFQHN